MMKFLRTQMKWIMAVIVVAFLLSTFLMYEGRSSRRTAPGARNADGSMEDYEVALINGRPLMRSQLEQRLRNYLNNYSTRSAISLDMPAIYQTVLNQAVLDSQMAKEVQEKGIAVSDAEADRAMKLYADTYFPTREAFYQVLSNSGISIEDYKRSVALQMANERLIREAVGEVEVSEDKAVEFYDTMKTLIYNKPEGFMVQVANFHNNNAAEEMRSKLLAGDEWIKLASGDNIFASRDIVNITKNPVFMPLTLLNSGTLSVLASLDIGQVSPIFSVTSGDFAVAVKTEHVDSSFTPYGDVSADIRSMLRNQEERRRLSEYETELMNKAQLVINDKSLFARPEVSEDKAPEEPSFTIEEEPTESEPETASESESEDEEIEIEEVSEDSDVPESQPEVITESKEIPVPVVEEAEVVVEEPKPEDKTQEVKAPVVSESKAVEAKSESESESESKPEASPEAKEVKEVKPEETQTPEAVATETEIKITEVKSDDIPEQVKIEEIQEVTEVKSADK